MEQSILNSVKKILSIPADHEEFDLDIITHINTAFASLAQVGVGPAEGFQIEDETAEWVDFLGGDPIMNTAKSYVYLRVRVLFDPPATSFVLNAQLDQIREFEWRLQALYDIRPIEVEPL